MDKALTLREAVKKLKKHYGPPSLPPTTEPFELILWAETRMRRSTKLYELSLTFVLVRGISWIVFYRHEK